MTKYIVVAGGVISGVGKGVTTASIGKILQEYGFKVTAVKIDPYINYDAGTLRPNVFIAAYAAILKDSSHVLSLYKDRGRLDQDKKRIVKLKKEKSFRLGILEKDKNVVLERHRHRYEVNPKFIEMLEKEGLVFAGYHLRGDKTKLMEFIELPKHRFFIATQSHPEFKSTLTNPAPLFYEFVKACMK